MPIFDQGKRVTTQGQTRPYSRSRSLITLTFCWSFVGIFIWILSACSTGAVIQNTADHSLNLIRFGITKVAPRGIRVSSTNQREYFSEYFSTSSKDEAPSKRERAYAHFLILGDRRPYRTEVYVYRERLSAGAFRKAGQDKALARRLALQLDEVLAKSREDRNFIDDFRAF